MIISMIVGVEEDFLKEGDTIKALFDRFINSELNKVKDEYGNVIGKVISNSGRTIDIIIYDQCEDLYKKIKYPELKIDFAASTKYSLNTLKSTLEEILSISILERL